jgi:hypothetical protein
MSLEKSCNQRSKTNGRGMVFIGSGLGGPIIDAEVVDDKK